MARPSASRFARFVTTLLGVVVAASPASAQDGCEFGEDGNDVLRQVTMTGGEAIFYVTRPHLVCEGGIQIWADSAEAFTATNLAHLIGSVRYEDPSRTLVADEARYFSQVGRLQAQGGMRVVDRDEGSTIENGALVYLRRTDFRDEESMTVTLLADESRPRATLSDAAEDEREPGGERVYVVVGDRIESRGEDFLRSTGAVELLFDSVVAHADTLEYEETVDRVDLRGNAVVDAPEYDLRGARIELTSPEAGRRDVRAIRDAQLTGEDFSLTAERIFLFARDDRMERLVALPAATDSASGGAAEADRPAVEPVPSGPTPTAATGQRPVAVAQSFEITADSLEILAPEERLERVFAAGRARSVSTGRDSLTVESLPDVARTDWLEGDTIVVTFVPRDRAVMAAATDSVPEAADPVADSVVAGALAVGDTLDTARPGVDVDRIVAIASARSLYRLPPSDPSAVAGVDPPAIHYVVGDRITIVMRDGEVERMEVVGSTTGVHLEPLRPTGGGR